MTTETLSQTPERQKLQVFVSDDAAKRLKIAAVIRGQGLGDLISDLADEHLPAVPSVDSMLSPK
jgi:hypothetical protein